MKSSKCHFFAKEIQYLVHILSNTGIKALPSKTAAIKLMNPPKTAKQVRAFLELVGYHCKFIKNFAHIAKPLTVLTQHDTKFIWTSSHLTAFNTLKSTLLEAPILHYPDPSKHYIVYTEASDDACGLSYLRNMMARNFELHSFHTYLRIPTVNAAPQNRQPMVFTMKWPNGTTIYKDLTLLFAMTTSLYKNFWMVRMPTPR